MGVRPFNDIVFKCPELAEIAWLEEFRFLDRGVSKPFYRLLSCKDGTAIIEVDDSNHSSVDVDNTISCLQMYGLHFLRIWHTDFGRLREVILTFINRLAMTDTDESILMFSSHKRYKEFMREFESRTSLKPFWTNGYRIPCDPDSVLSIEKRFGTGTDPRTREVITLTKPWL